MVERLVDSVIEENLTYFNLWQTLESGQVFRFKWLGEGIGELKVGKRRIKISQKGKQLILESGELGNSEKLAESSDRVFWREYFDLYTNYREIANTLGVKDAAMEKAIAFGEGIRILKQDPWEMLISFIISQNKAIPQIKQCIENICTRFGERIEDVFGSYYGFPTPEQIGKATEDELRECKVGFRAGYIKDACEKVLLGELDLEFPSKVSADLGREALMQVKGVGPKIADCILLFAYGKAEVFPIDVWIKRVVEGIYFEGKNIPFKTIQTFAKDYFGELAGYAQQYLFFYARENQLFK